MAQKEIQEALKIAQENSGLGCPLSSDACGEYFEQIRDLLRKAVELKPPKPIEPPEGYRLVAEGEVIRVGDMFLENGKWDILHPETYHIGKKWREELYLPYARKIEPTYRPFANAAEFSPHRGRWVCFHDVSNQLLITSFDNKGVYHAGKFHSWVAMFAQADFDDGTPFGVKE